MSHKHIYLIIKYYEVKDKQVLYYIIELSVRKMEKNNVSYTCAGKCFASAVLIEPGFFLSEFITMKTLYNSNIKSKVDYQLIK